MPAVPSSEVTAVQRCGVRVRTARRSSRLYFPGSKIEPGTGRLARRIYRSALTGVRASGYFTHLQMARRMDDHPGKHGKNGNTISRDHRGPDTCDGADRLQKRADPDGQMGRHRKDAGE